MTDNDAGATPWPQMHQGREVIPPPGVEWTPPETPAAPPGPPPAPVPAADEIVGKATDEAPDLATTAVRRVPVDDGLPAITACLECGREIDADGYCLQCGTKVPLPRDHYAETPADWVGGVCDRGIRHERNEDAMALGMDPVDPSRAVLVVCDGVSSSLDSDVAALAGARKAREVLLEQRPAGMGTPESRTAAAAATLVQAAAQANQAVIDHTSPESTNAASATFVAAIVTAEHIDYANLGDSRAYWVGDAGEPLLLTLDDSVAQLRIAMGVSREEAENSAQAHAITKWLGRDSEDIVPRTGTLDVAGPGWLVVCSDGLWNYASEPADIARLLTEAMAADAARREPTALADALVSWAKQQGGKDNITVALARLGELPPVIEVAPAGPSTGAAAPDPGPGDPAVVAAPDSAASVDAEPAAADEDTPEEIIWESESPAIDPDELPQAEAAPDAASDLTDPAEPRPTPGGPTPDNAPA